LYFTTPATARVHRFDADNNLAFLGTTNLTFPAYSFVIGSDGYFYAPYSGDLQKVNVSTGVIEGQTTNLRFYGSPLIRRNSDGSRLFVMELGLSGGSSAVDEFSIVPGDVPSHTGTAFGSKSNDRDLTIDDTRNTMFRTAGGIYGMSVWRGDTGISNTWPFDSPYGAAVAQNPTSTSVFGASASEHIREFDKDSGKVLRTFDHEDGNNGFLAGTVLTDGLEVAMNDVVVYGKSNSSSGPFYLGVIGLDDFSFPRSAPTRPMNVSATDGTIPDKVEVTWNPVMGATGYEIYRENDDYRPGSFDSPIATVSTTSWEDLTASDTLIHRYWVKAVNAYGESTFSDKEYGSRVVPPAPGAPTEVFASDGTDSDQIVIAWSPVEQASSYEVYRNTASDSGAATQVASGITGSFWADAGASADLTYYYWIKAVNEGGVSDFSPVNSGFKGVPPETTLPTVPMGVSATQGTRSNEVAVSWSASDRAETYRVYRSLSNSAGTATEVAQSIEGTNWVDSSVTLWTDYYYWVVASNLDGDSDFSAVASGFAKGLPGIPASVTASDAAYSDRVTVSWSVGTGATSYTVYRNTVANQNSAVEVANGVTGTSWDDTNVEFSVDYYYWVKSVNAEGESNFSAYDVGSAFNPLAAPVGVSATDGGFTDRIELSWGVGNYATSYKVFRNTTSNPTGAQEVASGLVDRNWSDTNVIAGNTYYYWIKSTNSGGDSAFSSPDSGFARLPPIAPTGLAATQGTELNRVQLFWVASSSADEYRVYRASQPGGPFLLQASIPAPGTTYLDFNTAVGVSYYYHVRAWTSLGGLSDPGVVASGHRGIANPGSVVASDGLYQGEVKLTWDLVPGASEYQIFRGTSSDGGDAVLVGSSTSGEFTDATGISGEEYHYFVKSATGDAVSDLSAGDAGMATVGLPFRPDGLIGNSSGRKIGNDAYFPKLQQLQLVSKRSKTLSWFIDFQNDGETTDEVSKTLTKGSRFFKLKLISYERGNVTALAYAGRLGSTLLSEASSSYKLSCKPSRSTRGKVKKQTFVIVGRSGNDDQMRDLLRAKAVTSKK
jgi:fibronectin type 3 domain-containing protein